MRGYKLNLRKLIKDLGGPTKVHQRLIHLGFDIKLRAVNKWLERDDIALPYLVNLMAHVAFFDDDGPLDLNAYIDTATEIRAPRRPHLPAPAPAPAARSPSAARG